MAEQKKWASQSNPAQQPEAGREYLVQSNSSS